MSSNDRHATAPWLWVTLTFGCLSLLSAPFYEVEAPTIDASPKAAQPAKREDVDHSDILYPSPSDAISKKLGPWTTPLSPFKRNWNSPKTL